MSILYSDVFNISTRSNRRKAIALIIMWLCRISSAEEVSRGRIPKNLHKSVVYAASENSIDSLAEAIANLLNAY